MSHLCGGYIGDLGDSSNQPRIYSDADENAE